MAQVGAGLVVVDAVTQNGTVAPNGSIIHNVQAGQTSAANDVVVGTGGQLQGDGQVPGNVLVDGGTVAPANSPGTLSIGGDLLVTDGTLAFEIGGRSPGLFDVLDVDGGAALIRGGTTFSFLNGYLPAVGDSFPFLTTGAGVFLNPALTFSFENVFGRNFQVSQIGSNLVLETLTGSGLQASLAQPVPEPSSLLLLGAGLLGLYFVRRQRART